MSSVGDLYNNLRGDLLAYLRGVLRVGDDAEDILQDAFLRLLQLDRMENIGNYSAYLFTSVRNLVIDRRRKKHEERMPLLSSSCSDDQFALDLSQLMADTSPDPDRLYRSNEIRQVVSKALRDMPVEQSAAYLATEVQGLSFKELSERTGVPLNTLLSRKHYAVKFLRERLRDFTTE